MSERSLRTAGPVLALLALVACAHPAQPAARIAPRKATPAPRIVVRDWKKGQDFWAGTLLRPLRMRFASGAIRASAVYPNPVPATSRLRVSDGGRTIVDTTVADIPIGFQRADLEGTGPVLLFDGFSGGAHCCFDTAVVRLGRDEGRVTQLGWGDPGVRVVPAGDGRGSVFLTGDKSMAYAFSSFAASVFAVQVYAFRGGRLIDISTDSPALLESDAREQWTEFVKRKRDRRAFYLDIHPPIIAYLADEYRLGSGAQAWARVRATNGRDHAFYQQALAWLSQHGYAARSAHTSAR